MNQINVLDNGADQIVNVILGDGSTAAIEFVFLPRIQRWAFNVQHPALPTGKLNGLILCCHPNIIRQWRNILPFGLAVASVDGIDPFNIDDFSASRVSVYTLSAEEVLEVENQFFGGIA